MEKVVKYATAHGAVYAVLRAAGVQNKPAHVVSVLVNLATV